MSGQLLSVILFPVLGLVRRTRLTVQSADGSPLGHQSSEVCLDSEEQTRAGSRLPRAEQIQGGSSREENWGHLGGLLCLAPGGLGGPWWRAGAWGRGSHLGSPTSALHFVWRSAGQSGAARDLGSDFYNQGWQLPSG